jgi:ketosteroid isomerase-like protein
MTTQELLEQYYAGFARKEGWESVLSDDFKFVGGDMTNPAPLVGKSEYVKVIERFSRLFTNMRVKDMLVADDRAFVLANYDYVFPKGQCINGDVVEIWKVKDGKLDALTIFFDTHTFHVLTTG